MTRAVFPPDLVRVGVRAFQETNLKSVDLSKNTKVTNIGKAAFFGCNELVEVKFPNSLEEIDNEAFQGSGLTEIDLSNTKVQIISESTFQFCESLSKVTLPETILSIDSFAFANCKKLNEMNFPISLKSASVGSFAFSDCPIKKKWKAHKKRNNI